MLLARPDAVPAFSSPTTTSPSWLPTRRPGWIRQKIGHASPRKHRALLAALDTAERRLEAVRGEVAVERGRNMRPAKSEFARELLAALEHAQGLLETELTFNRHLDSYNYTCDHILPRLVFPPEVEVVRRVVERIRASGLTR